MTVGAADHGLEHALDLAANVAPHLLFFFESVSASGRDADSARPQPDSAHLALAVRGVLTSAKSVLAEWLPLRSCVPGEASFVVIAVRLALCGIRALEMFAARLAPTKAARTH